MICGSFTENAKAFTKGVARHVRKSAYMSHLDVARQSM